MRPEQQAAVEKTAAYFREFQREEGITPHFLWNAKMRFGKTFAAYQLAKEMGWKRVLVLTFKPAVLSAWREDLLSHTDFAGWQFVSNYEEDLSFDAADKTRPLVFFGSFQDLLGKDKSGGIKAKNEQVHTVNWDCVIFDEYHYGAWREKSKDLFDKEEQAAIKTIEAELADMEADNPDYFDEKLLPITTSHYLYLSGTPFRAISSGEFIEEQIFNWTYPDEQKAKKAWQPENGVNPYAALPGMKMFTYTLPESIRTVAEQGEFDEFDLNAFFAAEGSGDAARFKNEEYVQKWLDLIRGSYRDTMVDDLKLGKEKPPMPFSDVRLLGVLQHTFWFLPNVAACFAMKNLIAQRQNVFLSRLPSHRLRGQRCRHRRGSLKTRSGCHEKRRGYQNHHALLRQTDHGRVGCAVVGRTDAAQSCQPRNLFSDGLSRANAVGVEKPRRRCRAARRNRQTRMLHFRFRPQPRLEAGAGIRLQTG